MKKEIKTDNLAIVPDYIKTDTPPRGNENVTLDDANKPYILLAQGNNDVFKSHHERYISGLEQGQLYHTVTNKNYGTSMDVCLVTFDKVFTVEPIDNKKDEFHGSFQTRQEANNKVVTLEREGTTGLIVNQKINHYGLHVDDDGKYTKICIPMKRGKLSAHKKLNTMVRENGRDRFSIVYRMFTVVQTNKQNEFYNLDFKPIGYPTKEVYQAAEKMHKEWEESEKMKKLNGSTSSVADRSLQEPEY